MENSKLEIIINNFKSFFYLKHLDRDGYNYIYSSLQDCLKGDTKPSSELICFWYVAQFDIDLRQMIRERYEIEIPLVPKDKMGVVISRSKNIAKMLNTITSIAFINDEEFSGKIKNNIDNYVRLLIESLDCGKPRIKLFEKYYLNLFANLPSLDIQSEIEVEVESAVYPLLKDVIGLDEAKKAIDEKIIQPSLHREIYNKYNIHVGGGMLLFGLTGTGKTMFAQAVANEINGAFFSIKASDIKSKWFGESEQHIKELFEEARKNEVAVIFFDEFEAIGRSRDSAYDATTTSIVPELLSQMQGFNKNENILLFIAATNRPWDIDPALLRPGRLDSLIYVDLPNYECRKAMIKNNLNKAKVEDDILDYLASKTDWYNGSDIKKLCDFLLRIVIENEINGHVDYELEFNDCVSALKSVKSTVNNNDVKNMSSFIGNYCN